MKTSSFVTSRNILLLILAHAVILKLTGLSHGLPFALRADEESMIGGALRMIQLKTVIPAFHPEMSILYYPPFLNYLYMGMIAPVLGGIYVFEDLPSMLDLKLAVFENMGAIFYASRLTSVACSLGTIWLTYKLALRLFPFSSIALFSAFVLSIDFVSNFTAHFARHWNATVFVIWLAAFLAVRIIGDPKRSSYLWLGLVSGIGFGISYSFGGLGIFAGAAAHIYLKIKTNQPLHFLWNRNALIMSGVFLLTAGLAIAVHPSPLMRLLFYSDITGLDDAKSLLGFVEYVWFYVRGLWLYNPVIVILSLLSISVLLDQRQFTSVFWGAGILLFFFLLLYATVVSEARYIILMMPLFAIASGYFLSWLLQRLSKSVPSATATAICIALVAYPLTTAWNASLLLQQEDTRQQALGWIKSNLPNQTPLVLDLAGIYVPQTKEALELQSKIDANSLNAYARTQLEYYNQNNGALPSRAFRVVHPDRFTDAISREADTADYLETWLEHGYTHFAIQYRSPAHDTDLNKRIRKEGKLLAAFNPAPDSDALPPYLHSTDLLSEPVHTLFHFERYGPKVEIYQIPPHGREQFQP
jgi:hypothetical protein